MPVTHELREFFSSLVTEADLQRLVDERVKENIYLEFKQKKDRRDAVMGDSEKFQFSRAVAGFANSDGGVLIWGVSTDKNECAEKLKPLTDVNAFMAALKKSILHTTQPVVDDIDIEVISSNVDGDGYVRCLIPRSERTPHRAMLAGREYYKRTTEGFYRLEHFDLEDMFGRRPVPSLTVTSRLRLGSSTGGFGGRTQEVLVELTVRNDGRGTARAPFIEVFASSDCDIRPNNIASGALDSVLLWIKVTDLHSRFLGRADFLIHPEIDFAFALVKRQFSDQRPNTEDVFVRCRLAAENAQLREVSFHWPIEDLLQLANWSSTGPN